MMSFLPAWASTMWDLRDYFFAFDRLVNDPSFQHEMYKRALEIVPIITGDPMLFMLSSLIFMYGAILMLQIDDPEIDISFDKSLFEIIIRLIIKHLYKAGRVFIYARALDVFFLMAVISNLDIMAANEILTQIK